ncbi:hypothetical protein BaRGS_00014290 [Batillaria attramentaria]|uniref:Uncharacterized protein n=1 Tax=Batillaria attramentaria TaxID=370345 RepID=A0ABD0L565_9CAEN
MLAANAMPFDLTRLLQSSFCFVSCHEPGGRADYLDVSTCLMYGELILHQAGKLVSGFGPYLNITLEMSEDDKSSSSVPARSTISPETNKPTATVPHRSTICHDAQQKTTASMPARTTICPDVQPANTASMPARTTICPDDQMPK